MKPLVIYHANCADGFGAAFAAWLKLGDEAEYVPLMHGAPVEHSPSGAVAIGAADVLGRDVYILDFGFDRKIMEMIFADAKRVVWLDHHKTAFEMWCETEREWYENDFDQNSHCIILNNSKSGAMLAWDYFHPGIEVPMFIKHIDDYDRWQFKLDGTKAFNKALWSYAPWSFNLWKFRFMNEVDLLIDEGEAILRAHDQNVRSVVKGSARECGILLPSDGKDMLDNIAWPGLAANCPPHLTSDVGHELATQSGTFGLCWTLSKEGMKAQCSLRSNGDYDVSAIAKAFGGGGHRNAAGFEVPVETLLGWMK